MTNPEPLITPEISVIVPVRNAVDDLKGFLTSLSEQTVERREFEVVFGDDGSTDGTAEALEAYQDVGVVHAQSRGPYAARNEAVRTSRGSVLAFVDVDCRPEPAWLQNGVEALLAADVVGGQINWRVPSNRSIWSLLEIDTFVDQEVAVRSGSALTGNLFMHRELFDLVGGFRDELLSYGDFEMVRRCVAAGARLAFAPDAVVWHPTADSRGYLLRKVYETNHVYAHFEALADRKPDGLKLRSWVPIVQTMRSRRRLGRPLLLNSRRLVQSRDHATRREHVAAAPLMYLVLPYLRCVAQFRGRAAARRQIEASDRTKR